MDGEGVDVGVFGEDRRRAVALVEVAVDDRCSADLPLALQAPDPNGEVVQVAKPLGLRGEAVMEAPRQVERPAVLER